MRAGRRERGYEAAATACTGPDSRLGDQGHARRAHEEHDNHGRDAGGVEAQWLVEGRRALPSRREGMRCGGERCEPGGGRACGVVAAHTRGMHGEKARLKAWGPRARAERTLNMSLMAVTLEVSKLSGWLKALASCRVEGRACDYAGGRGASREAGGPVVWWRHTRGMHEDGPTQGLGAKGTREAHVEHVLHGRDAGGVEAQRLVEGPRVLPS